MIGNLAFKDSTATLQKIKNTKKHDSAGEPPLKRQVVTENAQRCNGEPLFINTNVWRRAKYYSCTRKAVEYLERFFDTPVGLNQLAQTACMERTSFSKAFKRRTGMTLHEFVQAYRVSCAAETMAMSDSSITDIAFKVGFSSLDTFDRAFKRVTGLTPSQYRHEILRENGLVS
jgi:AraC-like DNA-binding protein